MASVTVKVNSSKVTIGLRQLSLSLKEKRELLGAIGTGQLASVRRTFREEGSPSGSWAPLSEASRRWKKYSDGHKLLIDKGLLLNSIKSTVQGDSVVIGSAGVPYAGVHQFGFDGTQSVKPYSYTRRQNSGDKSRKEVVTNKLGRSQTVTRKVVSGVSFVSVKGFSRHIRIPARPFLVFRPEDPARIWEEVEIFVKTCIDSSGLA